MVVAALFTKSSGQPATGLTLSDIVIYLYARAKSDGAVTTIWSGENPTEEIGGGLYSKSYDADTTTYDYFAYAVYSGSETLDTNYAVMQHPFAVSSTAGAGAITFTYTLTDDDTGDPVADADVSFSILNRIEFAVTSENYFECTWTDPLSVSSIGSNSL